MSDFPGLPRNSGRYSFDPARTAPPSMENVETWLQERIADERSPVRTALYSLHVTRRLRLTFVGRLLNLVPSISRSQKQRAEMAYAETVMVEMKKAHELMRAFAVDLTTHTSLEVILEGIAAAAIIGINERDHRRYLDERRAKGDPDLPDLENMLEEIDTERRIASLYARMRASLEGEALTNLIAFFATETDRDRRLACLRTALDESRQVDIRAVIEDAIAQNVG